MWKAYTPPPSFFHRVEIFICHAAPYISTKSSYETPLRYMTRCGYFFKSSSFCWQGAISRAVPPKIQNEQTIDSPQFKYSLNVYGSGVALTASNERKLTRINSNCFSDILLQDAPIVSKTKAS